MKIHFSYPFLVLIALTLAISFFQTHGMTMKRILVTGGNKGIGKAICQRLVSQWDDTYVLLGARDPTRGHQAIEDIVKQCGESTKDRLELIVMDTSSTESVQSAASTLSAETRLYGIINNAGIGFGKAMKDVINTNYFGPRRVNEFFGPFLEPNARIVNVASASGPNYVSSLPNTHPHKQLLGNPWTIPNGIADVDRLAVETIRTQSGSEGYGVSKALLNAYTWILAKQYDAKENASIVVNSVTPGYILTDLTAGMGATKSPADGAVPPCYLMMDQDTIPNVPTGRYYGSDCIRSPISFYRGPGEPPYESGDDVVQLLPGAKATPPMVDYRDI